MENFAGKKRPIINLPLFAALPSEKPMKPPRNFEGGVVGLGIVAAMTDLNQTHESFFSAKFSGAPANLSVSPRSSPIPIVSQARAAANFKGGAGRADSERDGGATAVADELSESYTCVISQMRNISVKKVLVDDCFAPSASVFSASPLNLDVEVMKEEFGASDFLSCCYLCNKQLHGLDIFMYRGEKAFCSSDCRDKHIRSDKRKEKCRSEAMKPMEYSVSPCSGPMLFFAGVAAA